MKQLKQSPVAKIIAWILITVSALMLLAGTAGAYAISELGFYTRSVEDIREEQFERIAGTAVAWQRAFKSVCCANASEGAAVLIRRAAFLRCCRTHPAWRLRPVRR